MIVNRSAVTGRFASAEEAAADPERHGSETVRTDRPGHWHVSPGGMSIYRGGELVHVIPPSQFGELAYQLAAVARAGGADA